MVKFDGDFRREDSPLNYKRKRVIGQHFCNDAAEIQNVDLEVWKTPKKVARCGSSGTDLSDAYFLVGSAE